MWGLLQLTVFSLSTQTALSQVSYQMVSLCRAATRFPATRPLFWVTHHNVLTDVVFGNTQHRMAPTAISGPQFGPSATSWKVVYRFNFDFASCDISEVILILPYFTSW